MRKNVNQATKADEVPAFESWALLELLGHRTVAGHVSEQSIAGKQFLRIDVYPGNAKEALVTQFYNSDSVYAITPITEGAARDKAAILRGHGTWSEFEPRKSQQRQLDFASDEEIPFD